MLGNAVNNRVLKVLLIIGPLTTLAVSPVWNYDPINLIKLLVAVPLSFYSFFLLIPNLRNSIKQFPRILQIAIVFFILSLISTFFFSGAPKNQQIFGVFGRNTGILTYISLLFVLLSAMLISSRSFITYISYSIIFTSLPMTIYCVAQTFNLDPLSWSEKHPFGTLGNINFSSAFFGLSMSVCFAVSWLGKISLYKRILLNLLVVIDFVIVYKTGSIQGIMIFIAALVVQGYFVINKKLSKAIINVAYMLASLIGAFIVVLGLGNKGPLAKFLFAPSIIFRTDYWHAGLAMTIGHPFVGVGMDSYGDWYRQARGEISTLRTGPERISNTAHNIFLDLSSNGGFPLVFSYILILLIALKIGFIHIKRNPLPHSIAIYSAFIAYLIFSAISIGQIGVGIWGWLFTGAILGLYEKEKSLEDNVQFSEIKKPKRSNKAKLKIESSSQLAAFFGLITGLILAIIPFNADVRFKSALQSYDLSKVLKIADTPGITAFHRELILDQLVKSNFLPQAKLFATQTITSYPRNFMSWNAIRLLPDSSEFEKKQAAIRLHLLDPYNKDFK